jgi:hypothetical protein
MREDLISLLDQLSNTKTNSQEQFILLVREKVPQIPDYEPKTKRPWEHLNKTAYRSNKS